MILGWVDQIGRKGNIVYSSSCSRRCSSLCIPTKEKFTYEKRNNFQNNSRTTFSSQIYYMYLTYKKKYLIRYKPHLISSPSLLPIPVASPYKYFHHRYLLVSFRLSFPVYSRYLPPRFETCCFDFGKQAKRGLFETPNSLTNLTRPNRTDLELGS